MQSTYGRVQQGAIAGKVLTLSAAGRFLMQIRVECYAGYRGEETPRRFWLGLKRIEVGEVQDRWIAPDYRYFKLVGDDSSLYIIRHDMESLEWELILYRKSGIPLGADSPAGGWSDS